METFNITIEERIVQTFPIEANTYEEAMAIARNGYRNDTLVLDAAECQEASISCDEDGNFEDL